MNSPTTKYHGRRGVYQAALHCLATACHWWFNQLAALCPEKLRHGWNPDSQALVIELTDTQLLIRSAQRKQAAIQINAPWQQTSLPQAAKEAIRRAQSITLYLPVEQTLQTRFALPQAARGHLSNVIQFEMDRRTPFKAEQVYFDTCVLADNHTSGQPPHDSFMVELQLVPKNQLDPLLAQLEVLGIIPDRVAPTTTQQRNDFPCNLLPPRTGPSAALKYRRFQWALLGCNLLLLAAVVSLPLLQKSAQIEQLQHAVLQQKGIGEQVFAIRGERETLLAQQQEFVSLQHNQISTLLLIDELTRLLPDNAWLNKIALQRDTLKMQGEASNASELIALLENSSQLTQVSFYSPVTQNPRSGKERFMISAQLSREASDATR